MPAGRSPEELRWNKYLNRACREVNGFAELLQRFQRNISVLGRSQRTFDNYSRHVAAMALHFQCLPTALEPEQVQDYLYELKQRSKTPSQTYFKHTIYGLRFLLKTEGLPYDHLKLPAIKALSKLFRAKYVEQLRQRGIEDKTLIECLFETDWIVYAKRPFGGPKQVIAYLGRYTHKVAISNQRIQQVTGKEVTFSYKYYKAGGIAKQMTLSNEEFTRRFAQHILPKRFVRIRHYGILSSTWKRGRLQQLQSSLKMQRKQTP